MDKILKPQLKLYKVSAGYIDGICDVISEQMHSALYHWSEMKNVFITLREEEAFFYKPDAPLEIKAFVVLTVRNSPIETLQSEGYKKAGLDKKISDEQLRKITSEAIAYFTKVNLDTCFGNGELSADEDIYGYLKQAYIVAWRALESISNSKEKNISFSSYGINDSRVILEPFRGDSGKTTNDMGVVVDGYDITVDNTLYCRLKDIAENKQVFFVDCFKMLSRNPEKLFAVIEYLLANDAILVTSNYLLEHTHAEKRGKILQAASSKRPYDDICQHLADTSGLEERHRYFLSCIAI